MRRQPPRRVSLPTRRIRLGPLGRLRRHPLTYWVVVGALMLTTATVVATSTTDARHTIDAWGDLERVAVARRTIDAGERVTNGDVAWRDLPTVAVPERPATEVVGRVAAAPIFAGEVLVVARLAPDGSSAVAAQIPSGRRAVAVPLGAGAPPLETGDVVDLVAVVDPDPSGGDARRVAAAATVVAVGDESVTVTVELDEVRATAFALGTGSVLVTLAGSR